MFGNHLGNPGTSVRGFRQGARTLLPIHCGVSATRGVFWRNPLFPIGRDRQVPANLMARTLQKYSVRTAIPAGSGAPLPGVGFALAVVLIQGSKLAANFVLRLSLDSPDNLPREKAA